MRSLGSVRARVERLASVWPRSPETVFVSWVEIERCPVCGGDLVAHAQAAALAKAVAWRDPRDLPPPLVWYSTEDLLTCPRCGAALSAPGGRADVSR
jgi:ribosomal protein S27E